MAASYCQFNKLQQFITCITQEKRSQTFGILLCMCAWAFVDVISPFQNTCRQRKQQGTLIVPVCHWVAFITSTYSGFPQHSQGTCKYLSIQGWGCSGALDRLLKTHFTRILLINWNTYILLWKINNWSNRIVYLDKWGWTRSGQESITK